MTGVLVRVALVAAATVIVVRPGMAAQVAAPVLLIALLGGFLVRETRAWARAAHEAGTEPVDHATLARAAHAVFGPTRLPQRARFTADTSVRGSASRPVADD